MKKSFFIIIAFLFGGIINAQTGPIDALFDKYADLDGFTSVFISGKMLSLFAGPQESSDNTENIMLRLKSIRILSQDSSNSKKINFYEELKGKLDFSLYEELMVVQEGRDVTKFLIRQTGNKISELLVITGGKESNSLISIRGDINLKELSEISKTIGIEELEKLEGSDDM
jgi:hypothetical protein